MQIEQVCHWRGEAGCVEEPDPQYDALLPESRWCSHCGPLQVKRQAIVRQLIDAGFSPHLQAALEILDAGARRPS